ncbi:MAG: murein biosynthesis integral membrane protein MurJ [Proteobacteria bacterium]|nr:murein biosynthesis integral membrane protein MurJ [Pseudomonadota bacterium]MBU1709803.1 murein biosynthesis integral membrane protein MurJ [Pseudomonadota bacterium]
MDKPAEDTGRISRSAGTVGAAVMCSRVLGLVREQVFAFLFGAGFAYDAFVVAFRIPNLLRDLFGEGALSAAFVTVFSDYDTNKGKEETLRLVGNILVFITILLSLITLLGIVFAKPLVDLLVESSFEQIPGKVELTSKLTVIMFPFLIFISLSSVVMGILNTRGRFFIPSISSSFFNLGSIIGGVTLAVVLPMYGHPAIVGMAVGTLIGGVLQFAGQLPALYKTGFRFKPNLDLRDPGLIRVLRLMVPAVVGLAAFQINIFVNNFFASSLEEGSLSWLNYAFRLFQFPLGVFGVAISIATLPVIAKYAAVKDIPKMKETYTSSLTLAFCLTIPSMVGLIILAEPIIRIIFQYGKFDAFTTAKTAEALQFYTIGLFAYSSVKIIVPVFYTIDSTRYPVIGSFLAVAVNIIMVVFTIDHLQHKALAFSISCAMIVNFIYLSAVLYRKLGGYSLSYLFAGFGKVVTAASIMGVWIFGVKQWIMPALGKGVVFDILGLLLCIFSGALLYGIILYFLKLRELTYLTEKMVGRIKARG